MNPDSLPSLSPSETEILRLVWQLARATVRQVMDALPSNRRITYATVQTLLRRLEKKGYVEHEKRGKAYVFQPAVKQEEVVRRTVGDFVQRLFGGDPLPLMLHLTDRSRLDAETIQRLRDILNENKSDHTGENQ